MVGYVSDTSLGENDQSTQIKNVETSPFHFCGDISDTILDFDSIKEWIEDFSDTEFIGSDKLVEMNPSDLYCAGGSVDVSALGGDGDLRNQRVSSATPCLLSTSSFPHHIETDSEGGDRLSYELQCHLREEISGVGVQAGDYPVQKDEKSVDSDTVFLHGSVVREENSIVCVRVGEENSTDSSSEPCSSRDDDNGKSGKKCLKNSVQGDDELEEGEIRELEAEMAESDDDDVGDPDAPAAGPIRSKNEVSVLPPVPRVDVSLRQHQRLIHVGVILSIVDSDQVIVEGAENHGPLNEGSVLWITETRAPLGYVDEIFGPVKSPYYVVRFNSGHEVPREAGVGVAVSYAEEFALHILRDDESLYKKGYDASGDNDEELSEDLDFSDDEEEAEHRRCMKKVGGKRQVDLTEPSRAVTLAIPSAPPGTWGDRGRGRRVSHVAASAAPDGSVSNRHCLPTVQSRVQFQQQRPQPGQALLTGMPCQQQQGHSSQVHQQSVRSFAATHLVPAQQQLMAEMPAQQPPGYPVQTQMRMVTGQAAMAVHTGEMPPVHLVPAEQPPGQLFPAQQQLLGPVQAVQFFPGQQQPGAVMSAQQHFLQTYSCAVQSQQQLVHLVHQGALPAQQPFCQVTLPAQQPLHLMLPFGMPAQHPLGQTLPAPLPSWQQVQPAVMPAQQPQQPGLSFPFGVALPAHHPQPGQPLPVGVPHHHPQPGQPLLHACTLPTLVPAGMQHQPGRTFLPAGVQPLPHQQVHVGMQAPHQHMHAMPAIMPPQQQPADMRVQQHPDQTALPGVQLGSRQAEQVGEGRGVDSIHSSKVYHRGGFSRRRDMRFHRGSQGGARFK